MRADIAKRLYEYRKASGMSQEQVANKIGVSRQAVSKWECAESSPDTDNLIALAVLYNITVDELLFADPEVFEIADIIEVVETTGTDRADVEGNNTKSAGTESTNSETTGFCTDASDATNFTRASQNEYADRDDYVDISLENGVHVRDSKKGEEVHVGWDGIHIDNDKEHVHIDFPKLAKIIREFRKDQL